MATSMDGAEERTGGYDCDFVDNLHPDDYCAICLLPAQDPQQTRCECAKLYCKSCYDKQKSTAGTCPTCRQPLDAFPDRNVSRRIRSLKVKCTSDGCFWVNELRLLEEHLKICECVLVPCSSGCGDCIPRDKLLYHYNDVCPLRLYTCAHCNEKGVYKEMIGDHCDVCPDVMIRCPNIGCGASVKRRDIGLHHLDCPHVIVTCPNSGCGANIQRRDVASHRSGCSMETINCMYMNIGCDFTLPRSAMAEHIAVSASYHLGLAVMMVEVKKQGGEETIAQLKEQHQEQLKDIRTQLREQHQEQLKDIMTQLREQHQEQLKDIRTQLKEQHQNQLEETITRLKEVFQTQIDKLEFKMYMYNRTQLNTPTACADENIILQVNSFQRYKHIPWYSPGFYTHSYGYKMCLEVHTNGEDDGKGTHVSVYLCLMKGENDDYLMWPMKYTCTITLLNQIEDRHHHTKTFTCSEDEEDNNNSRVFTERSTGGLGYPKFIPLNKLNFQKDVQCQYLVDDCVYFRVTVKALSQPKPWLVQK